MSSCGRGGPACCSCSAVASERACRSAAGAYPTAQARQGRSAGHVRANGDWVVCHSCKAGKEVQAWVMGRPAGAKLTLGLLAPPPSLIIIIITKGAPPCTPHSGQNPAPLTLGKTLLPSLWAKPCTPHCGQNPAPLTLGKKPGISLKPPPTHSRQNGQVAWRYVFYRIGGAGYIIQGGALYAIPGGAL